MLPLLNFLEVKECVEVGKNPMQKGNPICADAGIIAQDFYTVKELCQWGLQGGH
jgi:hypothetical protein